MVALFASVAFAGFGESLDGDYTLTIQKVDSVVKCVDSKMFGEVCLKEDVFGDVVVDSAVSGDIVTVEGNVWTHKDATGAIVESGKLVLGNGYSVYENGVKIGALYSFAGFAVGNLFGEYQIILTKILGDPAHI